MHFSLLIDLILESTIAFPQEKGQAEAAHAANDQHEKSQNGHGTAAKTGRAVNNHRNVVWYEKWRHKIQRFFHYCYL